MCMLCSAFFFSLCMLLSNSYPALSSKDPWAANNQTVKQYTSQHRRGSRYPCHRHIYSLSICEAPWTIFYHTVEEWSLLALFTQVVFRSARCSPLVHLPHSLVLRLQNMIKNQPTKVCPATTPLQLTTTAYAVNCGWVKYSYSSVLQFPIRNMGSFV